MKKVFIVLLGLMLITTFAQAKKYWDVPSGQGVSTVGTGGDYATLALAAADYNTTAPLGNWTMDIITSTTEVSSSNFFNDTNGYTIKIKPAATNPGGVVITYPNTTGGGEWPGSIVIGAHNVNAVHPKKMDFFTIDGDKDGGVPSRDLTITQGGTTASHIISVIGDSDNVVIKNCIITGTTASGASRYGIRIIGLAWEGTPTEILTPDGTIIENCQVTIQGGGACQAIQMDNAYITGHLSMPSGYAQNGTVVRNNDLTARTRGIFMNGAGSVTVENNRITINQTGSGYASWGIWHLGANGTKVFTQVIRNNRIVLFNHAFTGTGAYGMNGIYLTGSPAAGPGVSVRYDVYNNMVGGFNWTGVAPVNATWRGIGVANNAPTYNIYHNSVYMPNFANLTGQTGALCYGIGADASPSLLNIKNNIIFEGEAGAACIQKSGATGVLNSDNNVLFTNGVANTGQKQGIAYASLAAWQTATGGDANSKSQNPFPLWVSNSDHHFTVDPGAAWKFGADASSISGLAADFDAQNRDVLRPYVGPDEPIAAGGVTLTVASAQGSPIPSVGVKNTNTGTTVTASVMTPFSGGTGIQYVCTGYTGTGVIGSGASNSVTFIMGVSSESITWNWKTQYQLTTAIAPAGAAASGTITPAAPVWYDAATTISMQYHPVAPDWIFNGWTGGLISANNPEDLSMNAPKSVTANIIWATYAPQGPPAKDFGSKATMTFGGSPEICDIIIKNDGTYQLSLSAFNRTGSTDFDILNAPPVNIAAGTTETLQLRYTPNTPGSVDATFEVVTNDPVTTSGLIGCYGVGLVGGLGLSTPDGSNFGYVLVGHSAPAKTLSVTNTGAADIVISSVIESGDGDISFVNPGTPTINPGNSIDITVNFLPLSTGPKSKNITVNCGGGLSDSQGFIGNGSNVSVSPEPLDFEFAKIAGAGGLGKAGQLLIDNKGIATTYTIAIADPKFSIVGSDKIFVDALTSETLNLKYLPLAVVSDSSTYTLTSSEMGAPNLSGNLIGRGWSTIEGHKRTVLGSDGATVQVASAGTYTLSKLVIPAGAFTGSVIVTIQEPTDQHGKPNAVEVKFSTPKTMATGKDATLYIQYKDADGDPPFSYLAVAKWVVSATPPWSTTIGAGTLDTPGGGLKTAIISSFIASDLFATYNTMTEVTDWRLIK